MQNRIIISDMFLNKDISDMVDAIRKKIQEADEIWHIGSADSVFHSRMSAVYAGLFSRFTKSEYAEIVVAEFVQIMLLHRPLHGEYAFQAIQAYLVSPPASDKSFCSVCDGILLGVLNSAIDMDPQKFTPQLAQGFEERVAMCISLIAEYCHPYTCTGIESLLAPLFGQYLNPSSKYGLKGRRYAQVSKLIKSLRAQIERRPKGSQLPPCLRIISDQIAHKLFGDISTHGRVVAIDSLFDYTLNVESSEDRSATSKEMPSLEAANKSAEKLYAPTSDEK